MVRSRTETWLRGESGLLAELVEDSMDQPDGLAFIRTQASHALTEIDEENLENDGNEAATDTTAFFLLADADGSERLWVGPDAKDPFRERNAHHPLCRMGNEGSQLLHLQGGKDRHHHAGHRRVPGTRHGCGAGGCALSPQPPALFLAGIEARGFTGLKAQTL